MLINNVEVDVKTRCIQENMTQAKIAEKICSTKPYVNRIIKKPNSIVNSTFVRIMETLGYDIEITYIKKNNDLGKMEKNNERRNQERIGENS